MSKPECDMCRAEIDTSHRENYFIETFQDDRRRYICRRCMTIGKPYQELIEIGERIIADAQGAWQLAVEQKLGQKEHVEQQMKIIDDALTTHEKICEPLMAPRKTRTRHDGDCSIYASLCNGQVTDGICTCGYSHELIAGGDYSQVMSRERKEEEER